MGDFWFNIIWTICVASLTMITEFLATKFVIFRSVIQSIKNDAYSNNDSVVILERIKRHLSVIKNDTSPIWGAELSAVALSVDFAALGMWINKKDLFPFFTTVNGGNNEIPAWLILFFVHFVALLIAIIFRQLHAEVVKETGSNNNKWLYLGNTTGFVMLFSTFTILAYIPKVI